MQAFSYGISAIGVSLLVSNFLRNRDVRPQDIWCWLAEGEHIEECESLARRYGLADSHAVSALLMGASGGIALGLLARGYLFLLQHLSTTAEILRKSQEQMASVPNLHLWYTIMAVGFAPFAEWFCSAACCFARSTASGAAGEPSSAVRRSRCRWDSRPLRKKSAISLGEI